MPELFYSNYYSKKRQSLKFKSEFTDTELIILLFHFFPDLLAILLLGEPVRWETNLQLVIDCLVTGGSPESSVMKTNEQIPLIATNTDFLYVAEAPLPRLEDCKVI